MIWTPEMVLARMQEAHRVVRTYPTDGPKGYDVFWPAVVRNSSESYGLQPEALRRIVPSGAAIDRADEAITWLWWVTEEQRAVIWYRSRSTKQTHWGAKRISKRYHVSPATIRNWLDAGLLEIATRLSE